MLKLGEKTHDQCNKHTYRTTASVNCCHTPLPGCHEGLQQQNDAVPTTHQQRPDHCRVPKGRSDLSDIPSYFLSDQECWSWSLALLELCDSSALLSHSASFWATHPVWCFAQHMQVWSLISLFQCIVCILFLFWDDCSIHVFRYCSCRMSIY